MFRLKKIKLKKCTNVIWKVGEGVTVHRDNEQVLVCVCVCVLFMCVCVCVNSFTKHVFEDISDAKLGPLFTSRDYIYVSIFHKWVSKIDFF